MRIVRFFLFLVLATTVSLVAGGCGNDTTEPPVDTGEAEVLFMQAAPAAGEADLFVNGSEIHSDIAFGDASDGYEEMDAGSQQVRILENGSISRLLVDKSIDFTKDEHYTIFAVNDSAGTEFDAVVFKDDLSAPAAGKAHIRLANLVPDGPSMKLSFQGAGLGAIISNVAFKDNSEFFTPVDAAAVTLRVQENGNSGGSSGGLAENLPYTLEDGGIYTIAVVGMVADSSAMITVIKHEDNH